MEKDIKNLGAVDIVLGFKIAHHYSSKHKDRPEVREILRQPRATRRKAWSFLMG